MSFSTLSTTALHEHDPTARPALVASEPTSPMMLAQPEQPLTRDRHVFSKSGSFHAEELKVTSDNTFMAFRPLSRSSTDFKQTAQSANELEPSEVAIEIMSDVRDAQTSVKSTDSHTLPHQLSDDKNDTTDTHSSVPELVQPDMSDSDESVSNSIGKHASKSWRKQYFSWWFNKPPAFRTKVELALRLALAGILPAILVLVPSLNTAIVPTADPSFASVVAVLAVGENLGETIQLSFESIEGILLPGVLAWFLSSLFGTRIEAVAAYGFVTVVLVVYMPLPMVAKKLTLAQLVFYLIDSVSPAPLGLTAAWDLLWFSLIGCAAAIFAFIFPFPRLAQHQVARGLLELVDTLNDLYGTLIVWKGDPHASVFHRVHADMLHRKLDEKYDDVQRKFNNIWWEPHPGVNRKKYYHFMASCMFLRRSLRGMYSSMKHNKFTPEQVSFMKNTRAHTSALRRICASMLSDLAVNTIEDIDNRIVLKCTELQDALDKFRSVRNRLMRSDLLPSKSGHVISEPQSLRTSPSSTPEPLPNSEMQSESVYSSQSPTMSVSGSSGNGNSDAELQQSVRLAFFVFNMEFFALTMLRYEHKFKLLRRMAWVDELPTGIPHIKFQLSELVRSVKVALSLFLAGVVGIVVYNYSSVPPVNVAFIIGGHVGGSYSVSRLRFQGTVLGVVSAYMGLRLVHGSMLGLGIVLFFLMFVFGYVKYTPGDGSYVGTVASFLVPLVLLANIHGSIEAVQAATLARMEQTLLGIGIFIAIEMSICPVRADALVYNSMVEFFQSLANKALNVVAPYTGNRCKRCQENESELAWEYDVALDVALTNQQELFSEALCEPSLWKRPFPSNVAAALTKSQFQLRNDFAYFVRAIDEASAILPSPSMTRQQLPGDDHMEPLLAQLGSLMNNLAHSLRAVSECISSQDTFVPNSAFDLTKSVVAFEAMYVSALPELLNSGISPFQLLTFNCLMLTTRNFVETTFDIWQTLGRLYDGGDGQEEKHLERLRALFASGSNAKIRNAKGKSMRKFMRDRRLRRLKTSFRDGRSTQPYSSTRSSSRHPRQLFRQLLQRRQPARLTHPPASSAADVPHVSKPPPRASTPPI